MRSRRRELILRNTAPAHWRMIGSMSSHIFHSRDDAARATGFRALSLRYQAFAQIEGDELAAFLRDDPKQFDEKDI